VKLTTDQPLIGQKKERYLPSGSFIEFESPLAFQYQSLAILEFRSE
jgi:hypothetical protein